MVAVVQGSSPPCPEVKSNKLLGLLEVQSTSGGADEQQRMVKHLTVCETCITSYPTLNDNRNKMQRLDKQMEEMQIGS